MFDLTTVQTKIKDKNLNVPNLIINSSNSSIIFDKVKFKYADGRDLFNELSFEVPSGRKIAIVGINGSGKSTILRLLYRFYDPIEGRILINNQDIRDVSLASLRKSIGIIPQANIYIYI